MIPRPIPVLRRTALTVRRRMARAGRDRGANPVELAVVMPAILVLLFASIQTAAWFLARSVAMHAAQEAVSAQRTYQAAAGAGAERAEAFLGQAGDWLVGWQVTVTPVGPDAEQVSATVQGEALRIVPFVPLPPVSQNASGTVERLTEATG